MVCQFVSLCDGDLFTVACHLLDSADSAICCRVCILTHFTIITHNRVTLH
jgi:hypothetical protein